MGKLVGFIIASAIDSKKICNYGTTEKINREFDAVVTSPNWKKLDSKNITLESDDVVFYFSTNEQCVFAIITEKGYTGSGILDKIMPELIDYLNNTGIINVNSSRSKKWFTDFLNKYSDSKIDQIKEQVSDLTNTMQKNIKVAIDRQEKIEELDTKVIEMGQRAKQFESGSKKLSRTMMCRNLKLTIMIAAVVIIILAIVITALAV